MKELFLLELFDFFSENSQWLLVPQTIFAKSITVNVWNYFLLLWIFKTMIDLFCLSYIIIVYYALAYVLFCQNTSRLHKEIF